MRSEARELQTGNGAIFALTQLLIVNEWPQAGSFGTRPQLPSVSKVQLRIRHSLGQNPHSGQSRENNNKKETSGKDSSSTNPGLSREYDRHTVL